MVEPPLLKNIKVNWDNYFQYVEKIKRFQTTMQMQYLFGSFEKHASFLLRESEPPPPERQSRGLPPPENLPPENKN